MGAYQTTAARTSPFLTARPDSPTLLPASTLHGMVSRGASLSPASVAASLECVLDPSNDLVLGQSEEYDNKGDRPAVRHTGSSCCTEPNRRGILSCSNPYFPDSSIITCLHVEIIHTSRLQRHGPPRAQNASPYFLPWCAVPDPGPLLRHGFAVSPARHLPDLSTFAPGVGEIFSFLGCSFSLGVR
jgi:hypothetical protein